MQRSRRDRPRWRDPGSVQSGLLPTTEDEPGDRARWERDSRPHSTSTARGSEQIGLRLRGRTSPVWLQLCGVYSAAVILTDCESQVRTFFGRPVGPPAIMKRGASGGLSCRERRDVFAGKSKRLTFWISLFAGVSSLRPSSYRSFSEPSGRKPKDGARDGTSSTQTVKSTRPLPQASRLGAGWVPSSDLGAGSLVRRLRRLKHVAEVTTSRHVASARSQTYRLARDLGNIQAGMKGPSRLVQAVRQAGCVPEVEQGTRADAEGAWSVGAAPWPTDNLFQVAPPLFALRVVRPGRLNLGERVVLLVALAAVLAVLGFLVADAITTAGAAHVPTVAKLVPRGEIPLPADCSATRRQRRWVPFCQLTQQPRLDCYVPRCRAFTAVDWLSSFLLRGLRPNYGPSTDPRGEPPTL